MNYCGECAKLDKNQKEYWGDRYYCVEKCKYRETNEKACNNFIKKPEGGYTPCGCFITTIVCNKLGYEDNCDLLNTLRFLRENYLKKTETGRKILQEYDIIGPVISHELEIVPVIESSLLLQKFLLPCYYLIKQNDFEQAVLIYTNMVNELKEKYANSLLDAHLDYGLVSKEDELGKGRIRLNLTNY